jgi:60 kDa SS-A/Ro ribonucleoprotein
MLWEDTFYESGEDIAKRIQRLAAIVPPHDLAALAIEARQQFHLRHVPLLLLLELAKTGRGIPGLTRNTVEAVVSRADEMAELLAMYWRDGKKPVPNGLLRGLRQAALKFDTYQLNKWDRDGSVKLRDVVFVSHINFPDVERSQLIANLVNRESFPEITKGGYRVQANLGLSGEPRYPSPETWEALIAAAGSNKAARKDIWTDLLKRNLNREHGGMGYMAILRNLSNFQKDGVNCQLVEAAIEARVGASRVLPFRFIQAAKVAPLFFRSLDMALKAAIASQDGLSGTTALCVDCSGSMQSPVSGKSQVSRFEAAAALAGCVNGRTRLIAFGESAKEIMPIQGLGCVTALQNANVGYSTNAHLAVAIANQMNADRIILITDAQLTHVLQKPNAPNAYLINVAAYQNGVGYERWTHIDGFSATTLDYIREIERLGRDSA